MAERTVTISALSKTYSVTGWRVGWAIASPTLMGGIRSVHDFLTVAAAAPLQVAGITALELPASYYAEASAEYAERRDLMMTILAETGFEAAPPAGAYYVMADCSHLGLGDDVATARHLVEHVGVATVPGSSFFSQARRRRPPGAVRVLQDAGDARSGRRTSPRAQLVQFGLARCERVPEQIQAVRLEAEERPATALLTRQQAGVGEHLEVMAHGRLGEPERLREVAHAGFARRRDEAEQAEPGGIGHHAKRRGQALRVVFGQRGLHQGRAARSSITPISLITMPIY